MVMLITKDGLVDNEVLIHSERPHFKFRTISDTEKAEFKARWFWGDEDWIRTKKELDSCMSFRKSIKGKPTDEQMIDIEINKEMIDFWKSRCFIY